MIFVIKYWIISRKVSIILKNLDTEPYLELKVFLIFFGQIALMFITVLTTFLVNIWGGDFEKNYPFYTTIMYIMYTLPEWLNAIILADALIHLRRCSG